MSSENICVDDCLPGFERMPSLAENALSDHNTAAARLISQFREVEDEDVIRSLTDLPDFRDVVFVGHTATDMDSIGSALGCAELFDGVASRASDINNETKWVLDYWRVTCPPAFEEVAGDRKVCLVDHNQITQMPKALQDNLTKIVGCIDHHALQGKTVITDLPIYVNIQPWGSACSIVASMFVRNRRRISRTTAGILLCGILSDTLNLHSPTTTPADKLMLTILAKLADVKDINELAGTMFREKSKTLLGLSPTALLKGDLKFFTMLTWKIAFGTCETVIADQVAARAPELLVELRALKKEEGAQCAFFAIVDILTQTSRLLICGEVEQYVAERAFGGQTDPRTHFLDLGSRVSRKLQFIPPLSKLMGADFKFPDGMLERATRSISEEKFGVVTMECTEHGCMVALCKLNDP
jgi:manganese-dependent inorganic pyrophosphatase